MAFSYWMRSYDEPIFHLNQCNRSNNNISYGVTHVTSQSMKNCPIEKAAETNLLLHKNSYCIKMQQIIMKKTTETKYGSFNCTENTNDCRQTDLSVG